MKKSSMPRASSGLVRARNFLLLLTVPLLMTCLSTRHKSLYPLAGEYRYSIPGSRDDGLETGAIDASLFGADQAAKLDTFFKALYKGTFGEVHGILLIHRGKLVLEEYFPGFRFNDGKTGFTADDTHHLASVTKSLTSLCVGIAVDKGYIKSIDQPFLDYYPDQVPDRKTKESITIRHLLTMTAGLEWDESSFPYTDLRNDIVRFYISADPLQFLLDRKVAVPPGTQWKYCGACPNLLGDIIYRSSGYPLDKFAKEFLYAPLGITKGSWITLHEGFIYASGDAELRPRDMAKIGMLVLNGGTWKGKRVVSREWLELSMRAAERADASNMYGFLWWLPIIPPAVADSLGPIYLASGWGGQYIAVIPKRDLVLVLTGGNYYDLNDPDLVPILAALLNLFS